MIWLGCAQRYSLLIIGGLQQLVSDLLVCRSADVMNVFKVVHEHSPLYVLLE